MLREHSPRAYYVRNFLLCQGYKRVIKVVQSLPVMYDFLHSRIRGRRD